MSRPLFRSSLAALSCLLPLAWAAQAGAAETCGDLTCPAHYTCETETTACPAIACADSADCRPCQPSASHYCAPLPCTQDSDCADGMVCYSETHEECSTTPACEPGSDCPPAEDAPCETVTESACVPRYALPCTEDADCGTGFTCEEQQRCECSGSAGGGSASGGSAGAASGGTPDEGFAPTPAGSGTPDAGSGEPASSSAGSGASAGEPDPIPDQPVPDGDCRCAPTGEKACKVTVVACNSATDCPSGFTCEDNPSGTCSSSSDGTTDCQTGDPPKVCVPPYAHLFGEGRGGTLGIEPGEGASDSGSSESGSADTPVPTTGAEPPTAWPSSRHVSNDEGGCSIGRTSPSGANALTLAVLTLAGVLVSRRRSRA